MKKYWYLMFIGECPVCFKDASYRIRMYIPEPERYNDRYVYLSDKETYCGCMGV